MSADRRHKNHRAVSQRIQTPHTNLLTQFNIDVHRDPKNISVNSVIIIIITLSRNQYKFVNTTSQGSPLMKACVNLVYTSTKGLRKAALIQQKVHQSFRHFFYGCNTQDLPFCSFFSAKFYYYCEALNRDQNPTVALPFCTLKASFCSKRLSMHGKATKSTQARLEIQGQ